MARHNARFLCRDLDTDVREGNPGHLTVIIEFESLAVAKAAYESAEGQDLLKLRQPHSEVSFSIIEEGDHAGHSVITSLCVPRCSGAFLCQYHMAAPYWGVPSIFMVSLVFLLVFSDFHPII